MAGSRTGLLEDGLRGLGRRRRPRGGVGAEAQVGERGADVDAHGALERVVLVVGVERVGLVELLLVGALAGGDHRALHGGGGLALGHGRHHLGVLRGHHLGGDGEGLLQLRGQVTGLGTHGHLGLKKNFFLVRYLLHTPSELSMLPVACAQLGVSSTARVISTTTAGGGGGAASCPSSSGVRSDSGRLRRSSPMRHESPGGERRIWAVSSLLLLSATFIPLSRTH